MFSTIFQKNKLNRNEFEAFQNQQNDLLNRFVALERDINNIRLHRPDVSSSLC
jgi:hypothetical protein